MATLRVVVDQLVAPVPGGIGRYTLELTRQLIATAPRDCDVEGIVSAIPQATADSLSSRLPGLAGLHRATLPRRELAAAWQHGVIGSSGSGMVHATSLMAPLRKHDRRADIGTQTAVTIHDVVPWTHPETLTPRGVSWHRAMAKRAARYADAVVVPTHAVAEELSRHFRFGDRLRVIGGAVSDELRLPANPAARALELSLPDEYLLAVGTLEPRKGLAALIEALALPATGSLPLLIAGPSGWGDVDVASVAAAAGVDPARVRVLGFLSDTDLALVLERATVFVYPSLAEGFGLPLIEAFDFGTPVIHADVPALLEVADGSTHVVTRTTPAEYPGQLAAAIADVVSDAALRTRLSISGLDRARAFSWRDSAEKVWQLHADL
ncbi:glycosyltransferase family 4 protein [Herbiconiux flava]|uniref:Glycosyltransferase involved in cell wall biosynthesis n=1 Tax=Herbiconiux flava TaxID=881268 RepID=A0A852STP9_9MICO|nr:glycosyltransferase family 1 protein [Herbiconiux flava]NYD72376.1 glycosyltransferase involved in cell wall biosynthesis [Herbiconiux flava]GLK17660.1 glycosyl transferase [Herbiconiux flava]